MHLFILKLDSAEKQLLSIMGVSFSPSLYTLYTPSLNVMNLTQKAISNKCTFQAGFQYYTEIVATLTLTFVHYRYLIQATLSWITDNKCPKKELRAGQKDLDLYPDNVVINTQISSH